MDILRWNLVYEMPFLAVVELGPPLGPSVLRPDLMAPAKAIVLIDLIALTCVTTS